MSGNGVASFQPPAGQHVNAFERLLVPFEATPNDDTKLLRVSFQFNLP